MRACICLSPQLSQLIDIEGEEDEARDDECSRSATGQGRRRGRRTLIFRMDDGITNSLYNPIIKKLHAFVFVTSSSSHRLSRSSSSSKESSQHLVGRSEKENALMVFAALASCT